jgi:hypothetical protein
VLVVLLFLGVLLVSVGRGTRNDEDIIGIVIAYDYVKSWTPCYQGECEGSLIIRIVNPDAKQPRYVQINFGYSRRHSPKELIQSKRQCGLR